MEFLIYCECGKPTQVSEAAAGAKLPCACGRTVSVPALHQLRSLAGLSPHPGVSPELTVESLLAAGKLPEDDTCAGCGKEGEQVVQLRVECERAQVGRSFSWPAFILSFLFLPAVIFWWRRPEVYGQDRVYWLPLVLCDDCRRGAEDPDTLRRYFRNVPVYRDLLIKYPAIRIDLSGTEGG